MWRTTSSALYCIIVEREVNRTYVVAKFRTVGKEVLDWFLGRYR